MKKQLVYAIDPGTEQSAIISFDGERVHTAEILENERLVRLIRNSCAELYSRVLAIEMIASMGMAVGKSTFETCRWIGRFEEAAKHSGAKVRMIYRMQVKLHHCQNARAKDANISQALRDKYGGTKKGEPLNRVKTHLWSALAIAAFVLESD
jgi:hypothetical protein